MEIEPITREEILLNAISSGDNAGIKPITRHEMFLARLGGADVNTPKPITRTEMFLQKAIEAGGGKREGTAIPVGQPVERIYWNTKNTKKETDAILSQLTYVEVPGITDPANLIYANTADGNTGDFVLAINPDNDNFGILFLTNLNPGTIVAAYGTYVDDEANGWQYNANEFIASGILLSRPSEQPITDFSGIPIGAENEKIKNVLSITPF